MHVRNAVLATLVFGLPLQAGVKTHTDISDRATFIAVEPCRLVDTRNANGAYGGPVFSAAEVRTYNIPAGPCASIPVAAAYSLSFAVVSYSGPGWITAFPALTTQPGVSTVNYGSSGPAVANAAIVAATSGSISVFSSKATHVIVDINGYFIEPSSTITSITAGTGLSGGGSSGDVPLSLDFAGTGSATTAARSDHAPYAKIIIVSPVGTATENGDALLAAIAGITGSSPTNPYLVKIEPGIYSVSATIEPPQSVHIEGSGRGATTITSSAALAVDVAAAGNELRMLTLESTSEASRLVDVAVGAALRDVTLIGISSEVGVEATAGMTVLDRVWIELSGDETTAVDVQVSATVVMTNSSITLDSGGDIDGILVNGNLDLRRTSIAITNGESNPVIGIRAASSGTVEVTESSIRISGSPGNPAGIIVHDSTSVVVRRSTIEITNGESVFGVSTQSPNVRIYDSQIKVTGVEVRGVRNCSENGGAATLSNVVVNAQGAALWTGECSPPAAKAVKSHGNGGPVIEVDGGILRGAVEIGSSYSVHIGNAQIDGPVSLFDGVAICVSTYNGLFAPLDSTCN